MKRSFTIVLTITFSCIISLALGQSEKANYKKVADNFERLYNVNKADSIFAMFSPEMQQALPNDKLTAFVSDLHAQVGIIKKRQFIKYETSYASYKTNFDKGIFALNISVDNNAKINGLDMKPYVEDKLPKPARNTTSMLLPFKGEWTVIWGGDTKAENYHVENMAQKNAFDLLITDSNGKTHQSDGKSNEDYFVFGKELLAPCSGEIVLVVDGVKDNVPGDMNAFMPGGNMIIIKTPQNEYLVFCHFKQHSIKVKEGQQVKQGQLLGLCGNSGNSSEAHLHFHIQNIENINSATGIKCYFSKLQVSGTVKTDYSPVKGEKIKQE